MSSFVGLHVAGRKNLEVTPAITGLSEAEAHG